MKSFRRFQRKAGVADSALCEAVRRAERGQIDASLGGGLIKQRLARSGQGRSAGFRVIAAYRPGVRAVFLYGFAKNELDNIATDELAALRQIATDLLRAGDDRLEKMIADERLMELDYDEERQG
jgi:hypothetical protein